MLGNDIDCAADRVAAGDTAARALVDFHLLDEERVGDEIARIADVVDEDIVVGLEATDREGSIGISAFGRSDGQPRNRAGEIAKIAAPLSSITSFGTAVTVRGVLTSGSVSLPEADCSTL